MAAPVSNMHRNLLLTSLVATALFAPAAAAVDHALNPYPFLARCEVDVDHWNASAECVFFRGQSHASAEARWCPFAAQPRCVDGDVARCEVDVPAKPRCRQTFVAVGIRDL